MKCLVSRVLGITLERGKDDVEDDVEGERRWSERSASSLLMGKKEMWGMGSGK